MAEKADHKGDHDKRPAPPSRQWRMAGVIFFSAIALVILYAALKIIWPFITAVMIGAIIVTVTFPTFQKVRKKMRGRSGRAAVVMLFGITFLLIIPVFLIGLLIIQQANTLIEHMQSGEVKQVLSQIDLPHRLAWVKRFAPNFDPASVSPDRLILPIVKQLPGWVARNGAQILGGIAGVIIGFFLVLLSAYFFYVEGESIIEELSYLSPLPPAADREFGATVKDVIDATFRGHVITGVVQGIVTMIGLLIAHVPAALFWGSVATVLSLLPMVGAAAIWVPATIYLFIAAAMGKVPMWQPIFLLLWGVAVVSVVDNVIRPWAMKGRSQLPAIPLLFAVLGGLQAFGFVGLVLGPLVFALLMSIIDIYKRSFRMKRSASEVA
jgi:predicted PurR-regulated permease PerM